MKITTYFVDVQGTLVRRNPKTLKSQLIGGVKAFEKIRGAGGRIYILSNAPRLTEEVHKDLLSVGLPVDIEQIITSAQVTGEYIAKKFGPSRLYVIGSDSFKQELSKYGHTVVEEGADVVVVGIDRQLTFEKLNKAMQLIMAGAKLVAAGMSRYIPEEKPTISIGPIAMALAYATGVKPINTGKPSRIMYTYALVRARAVPEESAVISDDLEDLIYAKRMGLATVLVLTGATTPEKLKASGFQPDYVVNNIDELNPW
ncbi:HAD-IIA family hydrolase [Pyrobaculum arsenaticum]|uniref:HAD-superfamily hydrolase, subfamily IIA n=1 Tax=Pyrobaculum arsenaticum (strain DSM 13514 / JCM 11321 / PZ6) TaxID=340102 RepID=A4WI90_PYRAR|nr:HAD-IIA family hydrolase [Pyrobaculum arsenaticum]ABP50107.1 HAD-superfamily hydrolase, subfamily IIA [Pyrobaculum arsenaticum DSM 13514]